MWRDLRLAARTLRKSPGFASAAILTLALGIGANASIFSLIDRLVIHQFPEVDHPERVMWLFANRGKLDTDEDVVTAADFADWRAQSKTFEAFTPLYALDASLTGSGQPERLMAMAISRDFFRVMGTQPQLGRIFSPEEEKPDSGPVALLGDGFWKRRFGADPQIVGKKVVINGNSMTVIGVMPKFMFPRQADVFFPTPLSAADWQNRKEPAFAALGRVRDAESRGSAQAELDVISKRLQAQYPDTNKDLRVHAVPLPEVFNMRAPLYVLLAGVGFVLLIACANVANLQLARGINRQREIAVRQAMGAGRGRLVRQLLAETLVLALCGAAVGVVLAVVGVDLLRTSMPERFTERIPQLRELTVNRDVLAFTLVLALGVTLVSGIVPALRGSRVDLTASLKEGAPGSGMGRKRQRLAGVLVAGQVMLAMVLLAGAGVTLRSFVAMMQTPLGYQPDGLFTLRMPLDTAAYEKRERRQEFVTRALERVAALPGVQSAAATETLPTIVGGHSGVRFTIAGDPPIEREEQPQANPTFVSPEYFKAFEIPLLRGRNFDARDREGSPAVILISDSLARRFFAGRDAIGRRIHLEGPKEIDREIIGVVGDVADLRPNATSLGAIYAPFAQDAAGRAVIVLRAGEPIAAGVAAMKAIHEIDPDVVIDHPATMLNVLAETRTNQRMTAWLVGLMGAIALVLASLGIYGLVSYAVSQRTREIGIRMALGAQTGMVIRSMMRRALILIAIGLAIGLVLSVPVAHGLRGVFFLPVRDDTWIPLSLVALLLGVIAALAAFLPARRAARIDPMIALRSE
jgi:putative ABC transport system permease protein